MFNTSYLFKDFSRISRYLASANCTRNFRNSWIDDTSLQLEIDVVKDMAVPTSRPLSTLSQLLTWYPDAETEASRGIIPFQNWDNRPKFHPRTLVCHDMAGGYLEDRFVQGSNVMDAYRFFHWQYVDTFVYFSHNFVTIPPPCWINSAHRHNVKVLGTIITEHTDGFARCKDFLVDKKSLRALVDRLVAIAQYYRFDGWLVNIENRIENVCMLKYFVKLLTEKIHEVIPYSLVIWYDSVTEAGDLKWQDELNDLNSDFYNVCDGIFLNYGWNEEKLTQSAKYTRHQNRPFDVYVGIDVFGRGCFGGGGYNTKAAFEIVRKNELSTALFAQGWVYETQGKEKFTSNEYRFWSLLKDYSYHQKASKLPFSSSFCQGFGKYFYSRGKLLSSLQWSNLSLQQIQPTFLDSQFVERLNNQWTGIYTDDGFNGGSCLHFTSLSIGKYQPTFYRLHATDIPIDIEFDVSYVSKIHSGEEADGFLRLFLKKDDQEIVLNLKGRIENAIQNEVNMTAEIRSANLNPFFESTLNGWDKRSYRLGPEYIGFTLTEIGIGTLSKTAEMITILFGQITITTAGHEESFPVIRNLTFKMIDFNEDSNDECLKVVMEEEKSNKPGDKDQIKPFNVLWESERPSPFGYLVFSICTDKELSVEDFDHMNLLGHTSVDRFTVHKLPDGINTEWNHFHVLVFGISELGNIPNVNSAMHLDIEKRFIEN